MEKNGQVQHGDTTQETLLEYACKRMNHDIIGYEMIHIEEYPVERM